MVDLSRFWILQRIHRERGEPDLAGPVFDIDKFKAEFGDEAAIAVLKYNHNRGNGFRYGDASAVEAMEEAANFLKSKGVSVDDLVAGKESARIEDLD